MSWGYVAVAGATLVSGYLSSESNKKGANKGAAGQTAAQEAYAAYNKPYYDAGTSSLTRLDRIASGDFSGFEASPGYQFNLEQGQEGLLRGASSRGALNAGGTDVDLLRFSQGLASNEFGNYVGLQQYLAGLGQSAAQGLGGSASQAASNIGQIQQGAAQNQGAIYGNTLGQLAGLFGQYQGNQNASTYQRPVYSQGATTGVGGEGGFGNYAPQYQYGGSFGGYNFGGGPNG